MKGILIRSINRQEKIEMIYFDQNNQVSQRVIRVLKINDDATYCYTKRQIRTFKLDNILSVGKVRVSA